MKRAVLAAAFAACVSVTAFASADDVPRKVEVTVIGGGGGGTEAAALEATIVELLERVQLESVHAPAAAYVPLLSRVTVDLTKPNVASVSVVDARDGKVVMRRDLARDANPSVAREEIAHAVQSAVEAELLKRSPVNVPVPVPVNEARSTEPTTTTTPTPTPTEPPSPPARVVAEAPPARPSPPSTVTFDVATFAAAGPIAKSSGVAPRVGGGVIVALASSSLRPSLGLYGAYAPPFETGDDLLRARTSFASFRALPAVEILKTSSVALDWAAGGGFDVLTVTPLSNVLPSSLLGSSSTRLDMIVTSLLTLRTDVVPSVYFFASGGVEIDALTRPYVLQRGRETEEVFAPWNVRPVLALGFAFTALGRR